MHLNDLFWRLCLLGLATAAPPIAARVDDDSALDSLAARSESVLPSGLYSEQKKDTIPLHIPRSLTSSLLSPEDTDEETLPSKLALTPRAPPKDPIPLDTPDTVKKGPKSRPSAGEKQANFIREMKGKVPFESKNDIVIYPSEAQLNSWTVQAPGFDQPLAVGATAEWFAFGDKPAVWTMRGLTGCTATIIASPEGFWASHLWEASKEGNTRGGSSFNKPDGGDEHADDTFKAIAVDILTQDTPIDQRSSRGYLSLSDLKREKGDPLDEMAEIFVLTKSKSASDAGVRYDSKIKMLKEGYTKAVPGAKYSQATYVGDESIATAQDGTLGVIVIQYTPFQKRGTGKDSCTQYAALKVWVEDKPKPVIDMMWEDYDR